MCAFGREVHANVLKLDRVFGFSSHGLAIDKPPNLPQTNKQRIRILWKENTPAQMVVQSANRPDRPCKSGFATVIVKSFVAGRKTSAEATSFERIIGNRNKKEIERANRIRFWRRPGP
jgi:hypothetical protein